MKNLEGKGKDLWLPLALDGLVLLLAIAAPIYSARQGGLATGMLGQLQYFYLLIAALLLLLLVRDLWCALREARKGGALLLAGKYLPEIQQGQLAYRCMFPILFVFLLAVRPKAGALCVLLSGAALYFTLSTRLIPLIKTPGIYENGIYFYAAFYPWSQVRSYHVRESFHTVKYNVANEQKKLFFTGDVVMAVEDTEKAAKLLKQKAAPQENN